MLPRSVVLDTNVAERHARIVPLGEIELLGETTRVLVEQAGAIDARQLTPLSARSLQTTDGQRRSADDRPGLGQKDPERPRQPARGCRKRLEDHQGGACGTASGAPRVGLYLARPAQRAQAVPPIAASIAAARRMTERGAFLASDGPARDYRVQGGPAGRRLA